MEILLVLGLLALHVFLLMRFYTHVKDLHDRTLIASSAFGGLLGFLGLALMAVTIIAAWGGLLLAVFSDKDNLYYVVGAVLVTPIVLLVAEFLISIGYTDG